MHFCLDSISLIKRTSNYRKKRLDHTNVIPSPTDMVLSITISSVNMMYQSRLESWSTWYPLTPKSRLMNAVTKRYGDNGNSQWKKWTWLGMMFLDNGNISKARQKFILFSFLCISPQIHIAHYKFTLTFPVLYIYGYIKQSIWFWTNTISRKHNIARCTLCDW